MKGLPESPSPHSDATSEKVIGDPHSFQRGEVPHMPNLSRLAADINSYEAAMNRCWRGRGPTDLTVYALWVNFIRLVDVSVREYELARRKIDGREPNLPRMNVAIGHFESLLSTLK
jgi:hypothetical protein